MPRPGPARIAAARARPGPLRPPSSAPAAAPTAERQDRADVGAQPSPAEQQRHDVDALVASYLLNPGKRNYTMDDLAMEFLSERRAHSRAPRAGPDVPVETAANAAGQEADLLLRLEPDVTGASTRRASPRSTRRWSCRWSRCWRTWSGRA